MSGTQSRTPPSTISKLDPLMTDGFHTMLQEGPTGIKISRTFGQNPETTTAISFHLKKESKFFPGPFLFNRNFTFWTFRKYFSSYRELIPACKMYFWLILADFLDLGV